VHKQVRIQSKQGLGNAWQSGQCYILHKQARLIFTSLVSLVISIPSRYNPNPEAAGSSARPRLRTENAESPASRGILPNWEALRHLRSSSSHLNLCYTTPSPPPPLPPPPPRHLELLVTSQLPLQPHNSRSLTRFNNLVLGICLICSSRDNAHVMVLT
jgi:hypothetical protein